MTLKPKTELKGSDAFNHYETYSSVTDEDRKGKQILLESMFPETYDISIRDQLKKCLRVMAHHQNTSGFFITIIEKVAEFDDVVLKDPETTVLDKSLII